MAEVTTNASVNIKANTDKGELDVFRGSLDAVGKTGATAGEKASKGLEKVSNAAGSAARGMTRWQNALDRYQAQIEGGGDRIATILSQMDLAGKEVTPGLQRQIDYIREIEAAQKRAKVEAEEYAKEVARAEKEYESLAKQIDTALAKQKAGMSAMSADSIESLASARGVQFKNNDYAKLAELRSVEQANAQMTALLQKNEAEIKHQAQLAKSFNDQITHMMDSYATAGMNEIEKLEYMIQRAGHSLEAYRPRIEELKRMQAESNKAKGAVAGLDGQLIKAGMSEKQLAAAMRGVPAQISDIVVSLASGQPPMTVLLQQGGQLKDMFGGVGEAAKALGQYVLGLINPFTVMAGAVAAFGYAAYQGAEESRQLQNALLATGNAAGVTAGELESAIQHIGEASGHFNEAREAAMAFAKSVIDIDASHLEETIQSIADISKVTGDSVENIANRFNALSGSPLQAAMEMNQKLHFMDVELGKTIASLEKAGKTTEAWELAIRSAGRAAGPVAQQMVANAGWIERAWYAVRDAIKSAWEMLKSFGRDNSVANAKQIMSNFEAGGGDYQNNANYKAAKAIVDKANEAEAANKSAAAAAKKNAIETQKWYKNYQAAQRGAGRVGRGVGRSRARGGSGGGGGANPQITEYQNLTNSINDQVAALQEEIKYGEKLSAADKLRIRIENESVNAKKKLTEEQKKILLGKVAEMKALENERDAKKFMADYDKKAAKDKAKLINKYEDEIAIIGMGAEAADFYKKKQDILRTAEEQYQEALKKHVAEGTAKRILDEGWQRVEMMEKQRELLKAEYNDPWKALTESVANYRDEAENTGKLIRDAYKNAFSSMEDAFVKFVTTGKMSFKDLVNSILADIARMMAKRYVSNFLEGLMQLGGSALSNWLGGSNGVTASMANNIKGMASSGAFTYQTSGARASGGPVSQSKSYLVGENGPELFVPKQSGTIISNEDLQGKNGLGIGGFNIQIQHHNEGTQQQVTDSGADFDGKNLIIKIVTQDIANDGMISRTMGKTFGIRRAAGAM